MSTTRWAVAAAYHGECCMKAHCWIVILRAKTAEQAERQFRRRLARDPSMEVGDVLAIPVPKRARMKGKHR